MKTLFLILSALWSLTPMNQNDSEKITAGIDSVLSSVSSLSCDWHYQKTVSILQEEITASGSVSIDTRSSVLRWKKVIPVQSELVFSPTDVSGTSITKDNKQIYRKISKFIISRIDAATIADPKEFQTAVVSEEGVYQITMIPKSQEILALFKEMRLSFDSKSLRLKKITLTDAEYDITVIDIRSVKMER